jgi:DNA-directed RNA polymerase specialized sigma24 family protein
VLPVLKKRIYIDWQKYESEVERGVVSQELCEALRTLAEIVASKHYRYITSDEREDLISSGIAKGLQLLRSERFDKNRGSLKNFLYGGMRNEMTNFIYRNRREILVEEYFTESPQETSSMHYIEFTTVKDIFVSLGPTYAHYVPLLIQKLQLIGFTIVDLPDALQEFNSAVWHFHADKLAKNEVDERCLERLTALVIWKSVDTFPVYL